MDFLVTFVFLVHRAPFNGESLPHQSKYVFQIKIIHNSVIYALKKSVGMESTALTFTIILTLITFRTAEKCYTRNIALLSHVHMPIHGAYKCQSM